jgi:hypothetical protein
VVLLIRTCCISSVVRLTDIIEELILLLANIPRAEVYASEDNHLYHQPDLV